MKISRIDNVLLEIISKISNELNLNLRIAADDRCLLLERNGTRKCIIGHEFGLNDSVSLLVSRNKDITSHLLILYGIPCVEHRVFLNPKFFKNDSIKDNWREITKYAQNHNYRLICKPTHGSHGTDVNFIDSQYRLEETVNNMFSRCPSISLSPFYKIIKEIRFVVLFDECLLIYEKERPAVYGDGKRTLLNLIQDSLGNYDTFDDLSSFLRCIETIETSEIQLHSILTPGEAFYFGWKHNTTSYSKIKIINGTSLVDLARSTMKVLNLNFSSVDIIELEDGSHRVLEVNSGVCLTKVYKIDPNKVREVYTMAIKRMFGWN